MVNMLTVLVSTISNSHVYLLTNVSSFCKCKSYSHFLSKNICIYAIFHNQSFDGTLTNDIVRFEPLDPGFDRIKLVETPAVVFVGGSKALPELQFVYSFYVGHCGCVVVSCHCLVRISSTFDASGSCASRSLQGNFSYSRLSLSQSPRDSLKYFEISVPRHIRFDEL